MYNMPNHCVITSHTNHCPLSSVTSLQGRSFLPWWVVDSISGELAPSVFRIQALYPRCGYECPRNLPPQFSGQKSSAKVDLTFEGISFLFLRVMIILLLWLQTFRGTYFAPTFTFKVGFCRCRCLPTFRSYPLLSFSHKFLASKTQSRQYVPCSRW